MTALLWFLSIAAKRGFMVDSYRDEALGVMAKDSSRRLAMTRVTLHQAAQGLMPRILSHLAFGI
jgi:hypothetical protein